MEQRKAFVIWVSREPDAPTGSPCAIEGRMEEVDTGRELRFRSAEQLVSFLEECLGDVK